MRRASNDIRRFDLQHDLQRGRQLGAVLLALGPRAAACRRVSAK
jgi:hypothetical protein